MLTNLMVIVLFELLGDMVRQLTGVPVPGPVIGMALLLIALIGYGGLPEGLGRTASGILQYLPMLFVPAGAGVMAHFDMIRAEWPAIAAGLVGSSVVAVVVTAATMTALDRWQESRRKIRERRRLSSGVGGLE